MSDKHLGYAVTLDNDLNEETSNATIQAIRHIKGVIDVQPVVSDINTLMSGVREGHKWKMKLLDLVR